MHSTTLLVNQTAVYVELESFCSQPKLYNFLETLCFILMPSCEVSKQASREASLVSWLASLGTGQTRRKQTAPTEQNLGFLPSYKSRRSCGLSSVFPSVSRHVGPNPDVEIMRADAAAEFRQMLPSPSSAVVKSHRVAPMTSSSVFQNNNTNLYIKRTARLRYCKAGHQRPKG